VKFFGVAACGVFLTLGTAFHAWAAFPPLCVEISAEHPLFIFPHTGAAGDDPSGYAQQVVQGWRDLPHALKPFSTMQVQARGADAATRHQWLRELLTGLQEADVHTVVRLADADLRRICPLDLAEELVREFTCIKGIQAVDLPFEEYYEFGAHDSLGSPPVVRWLVGAIDLAARYGRFMSIELGEVRWPRVMSNTWCRPLYEKFRECRAYVVPTCICRGPHVIPQIASLMGLRLEGAVAQWGVSAQSHWYTDAHFIQPGVFGVAGQPGTMPSSLYRAMILTGAMTGATVYSFAPDNDLWFGAARHFWDAAIYPTLTELLDRGFIARHGFVKKKAHVAYQLASSRTAEDFHLNLRDIDAVLDRGLLVWGAYGLERPGQIPELIANTGRHYWVPILSPYAPQEVLESFASVVQPATQTSAESWRELLDQHYEPDGQGTAHITSIGRGVFIMNTAENRYEPQTFRVPGLPAPVRRIEATRRDDGILLTWPFREDDFSYKVYKRVLPGKRLEVVAEDIDARSYLDANVDPSQTVAYAVTALTDEQEPYAGTVNFGDYLALSIVESRIAEEVSIGPLLGFALSQPVEAPLPPPDLQPWWPNYTGLTQVELPTAQTIVERIEAWDRAFAREDLDGVLDLYSTDYEDAQGWRFQYVRRAYQWFFEHYNACAMHRQIRQWDFSSFDTLRQAGVLLYCRFTGFALTDPTGRIADVPAEFPRTDTCEVWIYLTDKEGPWRIIRTNPALPNFKDILSFSASPYDNLVPGPDL